MVWISRCHRGVISLCPLIVLPKKAKFSFWNADERCGAASLSVRKRRYACHCSTGVSVSIALTSAKNLAGASENPFFTSAPCALKNAPQSRRGVMALASSTLTRAGIDASKLQQAGDMGGISGAGIRVTLFCVVIRRGQSQAALANIGDL